MSMLIILVEVQTISPMPLHHPSTLPRDIDFAPLDSDLTVAKICSVISLYTCRQQKGKEALFMTCSAKMMRRCLSPTSNIFQNALGCVESLSNQFGYGMKFQTLHYFYLYLFWANSRFRLPKFVFVNHISYNQVWDTYSLRKPRINSIGLLHCFSSWIMNPSLLSCSSLFSWVEVGY